VSQRYNLLPALTALDNIIAPVLPYRTSWDKHDRARHLLEAVGLAGRERSLPARMSDDIPLATGRDPHDIIRRVGQLG
jgi:putative ABC transport system ATP-binding protein